MFRENKSLTIGLAHARAPSAFQGVDCGQFRVISADLGGSRPIWERVRPIWGELGFPSGLVQFWALSNTSGGNLTKFGETSTLSGLECPPVRVCVAAAPGHNENPARQGPEIATSAFRFRKMCFCQALPRDPGMNPGSAATFPAEHAFRRKSGEKLGKPDILHAVWVCWERAGREFGQFWLELGQFWTISANSGSKSAIGHFFCELG